MGDALRIGSVFSGGGGLDQGVEAFFGGQLMWQCESDPAASVVLAKHWPEVPNLGDITQVNWAEVEPVDILCGGFPCQDVSAAGRRLGIGPNEKGEATRSGLWVAMAIAIKELEPLLVCIENVRGLLSAKAHRDLGSGDPAVVEAPDGVLRAAGAVFGDLANLGYDARWATVPASAAGAPHKRERVFALAWPQTLGWHVVRDAVRDAAGEGSTLAHRVRAAGQQHPGESPGQETGPQTGDGPGGAGGERSAGNGRGTAADPDDTTCDRERACPEPGQGSADAAERGDGPVTLLPTPVTSDARDSARHTTDTGVMHPGTSLTDALRLLPTPQARDHKGAANTGRDRPECDDTLPDAVLRDLAAQDPVLLPTPQTNYTGTTAEAWRDRRPAGNGGRREQLGDLQLVAIEIAEPDLLPTPKAATNRASRKAMVDYRQWSAPGLEQALEIARGELPREFESWDEVPGASRPDLLPTPRATRGGSTTETSYALGGERTDENRPQGEVLLPTPTQSDGTGGGLRTVADGEGGRRPVTWGDETTATGDGGASRLRDVAANLLPTPKSHRRGDCPSERQRRSPDIESVAVMAEEGVLLPTPAASDGNGGGPNRNRKTSGENWHHNVQLIDLGIEPVSAWGKYEPAIRRWEALTRPAPPPTEPNTKGNPRLSARFAEWMMNWPGGWVTDLVDLLPARKRPAGTISRNDALRIIGNGCVPAQCQVAFRILFENWNEEDTNQGM